MYWNLIFRATAICKINDTIIRNYSRHKSDKYLAYQINFSGLLMLLTKISHEATSQNNNKNIKKTATKKQISITGHIYKNLKEKPVPFLG